MNYLKLLSLRNISFPLFEDDKEGYIVSKIVGLFDQRFQQTEVDVKHFSTNEEIPDITIEATVFPTFNLEKIRRKISTNLTIGSKQILSLYTQIVEDDQEQFIEVSSALCEIKGVTFEFTSEKPKILVRLKVEENFITITGIQNLPFGLSYNLGSISDGYSSVYGKIHLTTPLAQHYRIFLNEEDWLFIYTIKLKYLYGINEIPEGSYIIFDSDPKTFKIILKRPNEDDLDIESICELGPYNFRFPPNSIIQIHSTKIPSSIVTQDYLDIQIRRKIMGV